MTCRRHFQPSHAGCFRLRNMGQTATNYDIESSQEDTTSFSTSERFPGQPYVVFLPHSSNPLPYCRRPVVVSRGSHQATVYLDAQVERVHHLRRGAIPNQPPGQFEALARAPRSGRRTLVAPSPRAGRKDDGAACGDSMDEELDPSR